MKTLIIIIILGIFAVIGTRLSYLKPKFFMGLKNIIFTGIEYIFVGILLGEMGLNLIDKNSISSIQPFMVFGICWVGFLLGLQLNVKEIRKLPKNFFSITLATTLVTFFVVSGFLYLTMSLFFKISQSKILFLSLILGAISSNTAQSALAIVQKSYRFKNHTAIRLLRYVSGMDGVISIILFTLILSFFYGQKLNGQSVTFNFTKMIETFLFSLGIGIIAAVILLLLSKSKTEQNELILFLVGVVLFFGGYASYQNFSPLFTGLICGIIFANLSRLRMRSMMIVIHSEKALYIIILICLGATWNFSINMFLILGVLFVGFRMAGKILGALLGTSLVKHSEKISPWLGLGLFSEGGLSIIMAFSFKMIYPVDSFIVVSVVVISAIINELVSPRLIFTLFKSEEIELKKKQNVRRKIKK